LIKQAAGFVAQIDYEALDLVGAQLAGEVAKRFLQTIGGLGGARSGKLVDHICDTAIAGTDNDDGVIAIFDEQRD
jgi:hypothetical protein